MSGGGAAGGVVGPTTAAGAAAGAEATAAAPDAEAAAGGAVEAFIFSSTYSFADFSRVSNSVMMGTSLLLALNSSTVCEISCNFRAASANDLLSAFAFASVAAWVMVFLKKIMRILRISLVVVFTIPVLLARLEIE